MIRTTAEASNTRLRNFREDTSTIPVLTDQCFRGWLKNSSTTHFLQSRQLDKGWRS